VQSLKKSVYVWVAIGVACLPASAQEAHEKLYSVLRANDLNGLKGLLDLGISPNTPDGRQITPLMYATEIGSLEAMTALIEHGADVNAQNAFGSTALMWSVADPKKVLCFSTMERM
jgi:ankyrin repeat protein